MTTISPPSWLDQWPITYPCRTGLWTVTDGTRWGTLEPSTGKASPVDPAVDPKLVGLPRALGQGRLLSYRHHRRAVVKTAHGYTKLTIPKKTTAIIHRHDLATRLRSDSPRVSAGHADGRIELSEVAGRSLHHHLTTQTVSQTHIVATATAIAELHQVPPADLPAHRPTASWIETTRRAAPALAEQLLQAHDLLPPLPGACCRMIHTDLHDKNVLTQGTNAELIDFDGLSLGDPALDLGNLTAHLKLRSLQGHYPDEQASHLAVLLLATYQKHRTVDVDAVHLVQRHTWLRLAALYHFRRDSQHLVAPLIGLSTNGMGKR